MRHKIIWSKDAGDELMEIIAYIKSNTGKITAQKIYSRIANEIRRVSNNAKGMMVSPLLKEWGINYIHQIIVNPWIIYYRVDDNKMEIISIIDGRRNLEEILYKKMIDGKIN